MNNPRNADEIKALALAIFELNRIAAQAETSKKNDAGPPPEAVPA